MKRKAVVSFVLVVLFLVSVFPLSTFSGAADSHGSPGLLGSQSTVDPTDWWPMFHHDLSHTGTSTSTGPTTNNTLWTYQAALEVSQSSPAVVGGLVYVGSTGNLTAPYNCNVYCLNATTGALVWSYTTGSWVDSSPAVADGRVYVGSYDYRVYCLDASTGAQIWNYTTGNMVLSSPAVVGGFVYVGSGDRNVYCLNAATGALVWNYTTGGGVVSCPAVVGGLVYVGSSDHNVYCLNATAGALVWSRLTLDFVWSSPAVAGGMVYVGCGGISRDVCCLNATTGAYVWSHSTGGQVESSPAVVGGLVYVGANDGNVYCLNAATGALVWRYTTGYGVTSSPAIVDGKVYVGSGDRNVYCLNAATGALVWSYTTGGGVESSPAVVNGVVYVGSRDGKVYAFGASPSFPQSVNIAVVPDTHGAGSTSELPTSGFSGGYSPSFTSIGYAGVNYTNLLQYDTVIMYQADPDQLSTSAKADLATWVSGGRKLIIWDSDAVPDTNYDWLPYNFTSHYPGQTGAFGGNLTILANNTLGSSDPASPYYINTTNITQTSDAVGDAKVFLTCDRNWYGHMWATNIYGKSGFTHAYAYYQNGIFIYCGLDADYLGAGGGLPNHEWLFKIYELELKLQCPPLIDSPGPHAITHTLTITTTTGGTTNPSPGDYDYWEGAAVTVTALPETSYTLVHWELDGTNVGSTNPITVIMDANNTLHAVFRALVHDIAVTDVTPSKTVVGQGYGLNISVTAANQGDYTETSNITAYANATIVASQNVTLLAGGVATVTFTWNTTGFAKGNYTISAYAWPVPGETDTANNNFTDGLVNVVIPGDVDGNGRVNMGDISSLCDGFGSTIGADGNYWHHPPGILDPFSPNLDIDSNGIINMGDIITALNNFGQHYP